MQFEVCLIGNAENTDEKSECCYIYGNWDPSSTSCVGLICENGMFEYRDIYTNTFVRYQLINKTNHETIRTSWLHFIFINNNEILFTFEDHKTIYKTSYRHELNHNDMSIFPNNITQNDTTQLSFDIELRFECSDIIKCFDIDVKYQHILCGLLNGDILIGSIHSEQNEDDEEPLILISNCHQSEITAICGSLLNAFISSGAEGDIKIWDLNIYNNGSDNQISLLHRFDDIGTNGIASIYPFRCALTNHELVAISTVEGIVFVYLLNSDYKLLNILHTKHQSEILDISSMPDGIILSISTLNGFVYLFETVHFNEISFQKLSDKPVVFAKYKSNNNDFFWMDCDGNYRLYPQTRTNTEYTLSNRSNANTTTPSSSSSDGIPSISSAVSSPFTVDTPKHQWIGKAQGKENVFSHTTISSRNTPFHLTHRDRNIINPLKTSAVINQMNSNRTAAMDPVSVQYSEPKASSISKYYQQKMKSVENTKFDPKSEDHKQILSEIQKKHLKRIKMEEERRKNMQKMYRNLPRIPTKGDIITRQLHKKQSKMNKSAACHIGIEPSIKPFMKRSLEPERQRKIERNGNRKSGIRKDPEGVKRRKTISFAKKMTFWNHTTFNQC